MDYRPYHPETNRDAAHRIWREVHWIKSEDDARMMDCFLSGSRALVALVHEEPECLVASVPGMMRYLDEDLTLSVVAAVTTSRIARKQGFAKRLTANLVAADAREGAMVSALGMFEQEFYNQLGFGSGSYEHWISFDPTHLTIPSQRRVPCRLTKDDWADVHQALLHRRRGHGGCNLLPPTITQAEMGWTEEGFGLGYRDGDDGELTHFFWGSGKGEHGPYTVTAMAYQTSHQFLELMALLKALGDQVRSVQMREPRDIQLQDVLRHPLRTQHVTEKSEFASQNIASAYWQVRICDLAGCLARTHLARTPTRFNLVLHDPIEKHLPLDAPWRGLSGTYVVSLGPTSHATPGTEASLPTLTASVGAFTRLWLGIRPASGLAVTDDLHGPDPLLHALDDTLCLPDVRPDWDF